MTATPNEFRAYGASHPFDYDGSTMDQKCVSYVFRAGRFGSSAPSAWYAAHSTIGYGHRLYSAAELPFAKVPRGWMLYFDVAGINNGHIGMSNGDGTFSSANHRVHPYVVGSAIGDLGIQEYIDRVRAEGTKITYLGASAYFINTTLDLTSTAGGGTTPLEGDDDMKISFINTTNGKTWVLGPAGIKYVSDPTHVGLLQRAAGTLASESDKMLEGEIAIVNSYLTPPPVTVDVAAVTKAITDAIAAHPATAILDAKTQAALVAAQVTALAPAFAAVNANVDQIPLSFDLTPKH